MKNNWQIKIKSSAKSDLKKVLQSPLRNAFIAIEKVLATNPYEPVQSFEKLTPPGAGFYSRRINSQHRVVYTIDQKLKTVTIHSCWSHYESGTLDWRGKSPARRH
ncbi:Txe/YoeB family addiction module toxin [Lactobacillus sp. LC28-10]|uniref:Endoribonuclease YoeB n=1 Tax=Secundilactobacillus angelensis TaxID=2722706 RepID=A0ABX1KXH2_9LACO|nr:Txe/YoeB family addiction module toxin [Secundilactobacillus angelensis]MCH5461793.1 Txe/YoeB family addiction module toxin [Secundilactobacillus angelensis]NLR18632.1 Txe/YoeB family addiction module toxin [Secundilactobacillus angelensis]